LLHKKFNNITQALVLAMVAMFLLSGCFATATPQATPPMTKRTGDVPTAAMLPIINSYNQETANFVTEYLEDCLKDRNVFKFVPKKDVDKAVAASGFNLDKIFGLSASQYAALAKALGVDYVIHGTMIVKKTLKFTGWRRDADVTTRLYDGRTGAKVDSWRSMTEFAFASGGSELNAQKMAKSAVNHTCSKMMQRSY
jgi:hypothetical protein